MTPTAVLSRPTTTLRAALYGRVSHDKQAGRSVCEQEAESRTACTLNGWTLAATYSDNDISASRFTSKKRADWTKLVADLDAGMFDVLVLWEPSRGSRELMTWAALLDACRRRKVLVHVTSHQHTYDLAKPRDWRSLAEDGVDSAYESEKASQRIRRSMTANAIAGRPHGRTPYGYLRRYDPATKALVAQEINPLTAPIVREITRRLAAAEPVITVTKDLNARGVLSPAGGKWNRQNVREIALSRTYIAEREHIAQRGQAGEIHPGNWPAIVEQDVWYAARRILLDPKRKVTKPGRYKYLLSYIAFCGVCDGRLQAANRRQGSVYFCVDAGHVSAGVAWVDDIVTPVVLAMLADERVMARLAGGDDEAVLAARGLASALRVRLDGFRDSAAEGKCSPASLAHVEARLLADIEAAEKKANKSSVPSVLRSLVGADNIQARWDALSIAGRRQVVSALRITITLDRAARRGRHSLDDYDRVRIEPVPVES